MKDVFYKSLILVLLILSLTAIFAYYLSEYRISYLETKINDSTYELFDLMIGIPLIDSNDCSIFNSNINSFNLRVYKLGSYLEEVELSEDYPKIYHSLKIRYNYLNTLLYYKYLDYYELCGYDSKKLILYFYDSTPNSKYQGHVLDSVVSKDSAVKVFSVASYLDSLPLDIILNKSESKIMPVLYIEGKFYHGYQSFDDILSIINS